jgi:hypothetical protein
MKHVEDELPFPVRVADGVRGDDGSRELARAT